MFFLCVLLLPLRHGISSERRFFLNLGDWVFFFPFIWCLFVEGFCERVWVWIGIARAIVDSLHQVC